MSLLAQRYAQALYNAATASTDALDTLRLDLADLEKMYKQSLDLKEFFETPVLSVEKKTDILDLFIKKAKFSPLTSRFLVLLNQQQRLNKMSLILKAFHVIDQSTSSSATVQVTTTHSLSQAQQKRLKTILKRKLSQEIVLNEVLDPHLLGGMIVEVGNDRLDTTLQTRLQTLDHTLRGL